VCRLNGSLSVKLSRIRDLEENVLHNVRAERPLEFKGLALCSQT